MRLEINLLIISLIIFVNCEESENRTETTTAGIADKNFDYDSFDEQNKFVDMTLNENCTKHDDCTSKNTFCDPSFSTCECEITSMQINFKCKTFPCKISSDCSMMFEHSTCVVGHCQCTSGRKLKGKCLRRSGMPNQSTVLPDWAIISIAGTLALTIIAGGSLKKREFRESLMKLIRLLLFKEDTQTETNATDDTDIELNNKDIELQDMTTK